MSQYLAPVMSLDVVCVSTLSNKMWEDNGFTRVTFCVSSSFVMPTIDYYLYYHLARLLNTTFLFIHPHLHLLVSNPNDFDVVWG